MHEARDIYAAIVARGRRGKLPGAWKRFWRPPQFIELPGVGQPLLDELTRRFSKPELVKARVIPDSGKAQLSSLLCTPGLLFAVHDQNDPRPADLVGERVASLSRLWSVESALADHVLQANLTQAEQQLIVAPTILDCAVLATFGLPAIPLGGLAKLPANLLASMTKVFRLETKWSDCESYDEPEWQGEEGPAKLEPTPIELVLANWSAASLDTGDVPTMVELRHDLVDVDQFLRLELARFAVWKPTAAHLDRLRYCLARGTKAIVRRALHESMAAASEPLKGPSPPLQQAKTYSEAIALWSELPDGPAFASQKSRAWSRLLRFMREDFVDPLRRAALELQDPIQRERQAAVADISALLHPQLLRLAAEFGNLGDGRGGRPPLAFPAEGLSQALALIDRQLAIVDEEKPCSKRRTKRFSLKPARPTKSSSPSSGSDQKLGRH